MKKNYLAMAALACGLLSFSACSSDDDFGGDEQTSVATGELCDVTVNLNFELNSASTRAGRPLYSQEALQQVNDMSLYLFKKGEGSDNEYYFVKEITDANGFGFKNSTAIGNQDETYRLTDKLTKGDYKFLAVGLEESTTYTALSFTPGGETLTNGTKLSEATLALANTTSGVAAEVFSGVSDNINVAADKETFNVGVELNRTVAGILGYFKNIPYTISGKVVKHVKVLVSAKGTVANLAARSAKTNDNTQYTLIDIDLSSATHGEVEGKDIYTNTNGNISGVKAVANSFLGGGYSLPIEAVNGKATIRVSMTDGTGNELAGYDVKVNKVNKIDQDATATTINVGDTQFPLVANYFYSIGKKLKNNSDGSETDENPDDDDDPIDLSVEQELVITVSASWAYAFDLGLVM